jgi:SAM-dependent methyltransferase
VSCPPPRQSGAGDEPAPAGSEVSTAGLFERLAARYDAWYGGPAGAAVFASEVECLRPLLAGLPRPRAEVGAGSGRFAAGLGVEVGLDPAAAPLRLARSRGIRVIQGAGERLPFRPGVFGAVLIVVTVCFAEDPAALLAEACRVIRGDGAVILGEVFAGSPWGRFYQRQGTAGHPFYAAARFLTRAEALTLTADAGLRLQAARSALYQPPSGTPRPERPRDGEAGSADFVCWRTVPAEETPPGPPSR